MENEWYYLVDDGGQIGPFSSRMMIQLFEDEKIHKETYVWNEVLDRWHYFCSTSLYEHWKAKWHNNHKSTAVHKNSRMEQWEKRIVVRERTMLFFSSIYKIHTWKETNDLLFLHSYQDDSTPKPWMYTRVLFVMLFLFSLLYSAVILLHAQALLPMLTMITAFMSPIVWLFFYAEIQSISRTLPIINLVIVVLSSIISIAVHTMASLINLPYVTPVLLFAALLFSIAYAMRLDHHLHFQRALFLGALIAAPYSIIDTSLAVSISYLPTLLLSFGTYMIWGVFISFALYFGVKKVKSLGLLLLVFSLIVGWELLTIWYSSALIVFISLLGCGTILRSVIQSEPVIKG